MNKHQRKRIMASLLATALFLPALTMGRPITAAEALQASASETQASEGLDYTSNGDGTCYVSGIGYFEGTDLVIPSVSPDGESVTMIGNYAFNGHTELTSVSFPKSLTTIGSHSFDGCTKLSNVTVPMGVTTIDEWAFSGCTALTSVTISETVTTIGGWAFYDCSSLTNITIPNSVTEINNDAFNGCTSLTSITIPGSVTKIGYGIFAGCISLKSITVSKDNPVYHSAGNCLIETDKKVLLAACENSVIPNDGSVTSIGSNAFLEFINLESIIIPEGVAVIRAGAFYNCGNLKSITIPDSVTEIKSYSFTACTSLESITFPDSLTSIGSYAFYGCTALTDILLPESVTVISEGAFNNCLFSDITVLNPDCELSLPEEGTPCISSSVTICGYANSTAQTYAEQNGNPFVALPENGEIDLSVNGDKVAIDATDIDDDSVRIPLNVTATLAGKETTVKTPVGTIIFDSTASDKIAAAGSDVLLTVTDVTTDDELANAVKAFDISLTADGVPILPAAHANTNGTIAVSLPYLKGLQIQNIAVTYIGEDGTTEDISVAAYDPETGVVTFVLTHLLRYEISALIHSDDDHSYGEWKSDGKSTHTHLCECGATETADHEWNEGEVTTSATHTTKGEKTYTCIICGETKTEPIPAITTTVPVTTETSPVTSTTSPITTTQPPVTPPPPVTTPLPPITSEKPPITIPSVTQTSEKPPIVIPTIPVTTPTPPMTIPTAPITTPNIPVTTPNTPVTTPGNPVTTPEVPVTTLDSPVTTPIVPITSPNTPVTTPEVPATTPNVLVTPPIVSGAESDDPQGTSASPETSVAPDKTTDVTSPTTTPTRNDASDGTLENNSISWLKPTLYVVIGLIIVISAVMIIILFRQKKND